MRKWAFLFGGFVIAIGFSKAQHESVLDTSKTLNVFEVVDSRMHWRDVEQNLIRFTDSLHRPVGLGSIDFGDRLSLEMPLFIRNYGPGSLSTLSVRGFSAQHTGFIWNGFNIQSPMNATADMSLFPTWLMEDVAFRQGPSTDVWGNGNIGGAVVSQTKFADEPLLLSLHQSIGSFGLLNSGLKAQIQRNNLKVKLGGMRRAAENDFPFINHSQPEKPMHRQTHAQFEAYDLMASVIYSINQKHSISFDLWAMDANRNIPGIMSVPINSAVQKDLAIRNNLAYYFVHNRSKLTFRSAYFFERLDFTDSLMQIDSKNKARSVLNDVLYELNLPDGWKISLNFFHGNYSADATGYQGITAHQQRWVGMVAAEKLFWNNKFHVTARIRKEWLDGKELPYTPGFNMGYQLPKSWSINAGGAMSYRVPTFNDLYWLPGGNPNLNPEDGKHVQVSIQKKAQIQSAQIALKAIGYRSEIANWIQWQPISMAIWMPDNIHTVTNQGAELYLKLIGRVEEWQWYVSVNAAVLQATGQQSASIQRNQLIYVPKHHANVQAGFSKQAFRFMVYHQFTGLRYTTTDNSHFLPAFQLTGIQLSKEFKWKKNHFQAFASCNNLFNTDYQVMMMRAMPGRNFQVGINYQLIPTPHSMRRAN